MLQRDHDDDLLYHPPQQNLDFEDTVLGALQWMERQLGPGPETFGDTEETKQQPTVIQRRKNKVVRTTSSFLQRALSGFNLELGSSNTRGGKSRNSASHGIVTGWDGVLFGTGVVVGTVASALFIRTANKKGG